jgi:hypothetical protein
MLQAVLDARTKSPKDNSKPLVIDVTPKSCTVVRNNYHEASTWQAEFDVRELPFDPDIIASCAVRVYMWDSEGDESREWHVEKYEMLRGLADEISYKGGDGQRISMSGRDYQAALDNEWDPHVMIVSGVPLDRAVQDVADKAAPKGNQNRFLVSFIATNDDGSPMKAPVIGGALRSTKKKGLWVKPGKTVWEVIYEMVTTNGFIVYIRDSTIFIANPRTQTQASLARAPRIIYGRDLISIEAKRKLAKEKSPRIIIVYWDPRTKQKVEVSWPNNAREITTGLGLKKNEDMRVPAPRGCIDRDTALRYAKMRWDLLARAEAEYTFITSHMKIDVGSVQAQLGPAQDGSRLSGIQSEFDLMQLQAGDAIGVGFDPFNREHLRSLQVGERVEYILGMGYPPAIARFVANNVERLVQFSQPYYAHKMTYTFDEQNGLEIEVEAINYAAEARELAWADSTQPDAVSGA